MSTSTKNIHFVAKTCLLNFFSLLFFERKYLYAALGSSSGKSKCILILLTKALYKFRY